jgi:hypothetical protein
MSLTGQPRDPRAPDLDAVREEALSAIVKLAQRKEHRAKSQPGEHAERGHDDLRTLHDPSAMREAIEFYRLAMSLGRKPGLTDPGHADPTVAHWKGMAEELIGDFDAATRTFEGMARLISAQSDAAPWMRTYEDVASAALLRLARKRAEAGPKRVADIVFAAKQPRPSEDMHASMKALLDAFAAPARADGSELEALMGVAVTASRYAPTLRDAAASVPAAHEGPSSRATQALQGAEALEFNAACSRAQSFGDALAQGDYADAHAMVCAALRKTMTVHRLENIVTDMMMGEGITQARVTVTESDWPARQAGEAAWAYISLEGPACREAATVIVAREREGGREELVICDLEWGRP